MRNILFLVALFSLISCKSHHSYMEGKESQEIIRLILSEYQHVGTLLCQMSLDYQATEILSFDKTLEQALNFKLIEEVQTYSPPDDDPLLGDLLKKEDLDFMKSSIGDPIKWKEGEIDSLIEMSSCSNSTLQKPVMKLRLSKPLFNKTGDKAIMYISETTLEYNIKLLLLKKTRSSWVTLLDLSV